MPTQQPEPTTTERYAAWLAGLTWQQVPTNAQHQTARDFTGARQTSALFVDPHIESSAVKTRAKKPSA